MRNILGLVLALTVQVCLPACALRLDKMTDNQKAELLATEKGKLPELTDPVEITKAQITISNVLLDFVSGAAVDRDVAGMNKLLPQYVLSVQAARDAMVGSGRDPVRRAQGYKDLEATAREHVRRLQEISTTVDLDQRPPIDKAREVTESIRNEMFQLLVPQG